MRRIKIKKVLDIVEKVEDPARQITLNDAQKLNENKCWRNKSGNALRV